MTRVLHVLEALEGGTARHLVDVVRYVEGFDHHVVIPPRRRGGLTDETAAPRILDAGATIHTIDMRRAPWHPANIGAAVALRRRLGDVRPDVVHGHSSIGGVLARVVAPAATPVVYTPNAVSSATLARAVERGLRRRTARFIATSQSEADLALQLGLVDEDRLAVIPNGIAIDRPPPPGPGLRKRLGVSPDTPLVGTIARLVGQKAPDEFVRCCSLVRRDRDDARFVLIGDGTLARAIDRLIDQLGLRPRLVRIPSLVDAGLLLGDLDVYVSSARFEGGPYAPLEAMAAEVPVVLTDVIGNRDVVADGATGVLCPPGDPAAMAREVVALLADPERRSRLGRAGRRRVVERFDVATMGTSLAALYRSLV